MKQEKIKRKKLFKEKLIDKTSKLLKDKFQKEVIMKPEYYDVN